VFRATGRAEEARRLDEQARDGLINAYGDTHPFTLQASINYASDLSGCGDLATALRVGRETLNRCGTSLSDDHPDTLMAAVNLAIDEAASGNQATASRLHADALRRYEETLTTEHPEAQAAAQWIRIAAEIEPY